ncbi:4Fe-4S single cluster domain-containing protein [Pectobacterium polaris]|uniref:Anaerobic ribonucleoside-triphosphate reductase-activating protein n=1 Tax=Pectobacterium polaris TaxID=2042057 RepID=A0AAW4NYT6_9GAMM|nr:4Fe-4S single cluster domain-containing protein [Pectobacterium polaris]MBW5892239.1 radical SAM protein [Pectobacterium polaris]MCA6941186.1 radical SAM protein [Pectobacterium polaris]MCA6955454.1 radical SAM protein [Pectobacterium polaris]MCL6361346.1 radical SAM protein [Pectobacterium polaris]MCU1798477.1 radical SAM protein [Pectobacterium polaris]
MHWLNVASRLPCTEAEGPGRRAALWVQGCNKRCRGCCNPGYLPLVERELVSTSSVLDWLANAHHVHDLEGVTFLGGEPMLQAQGLAVVAQGARLLGLSVMVFSGYTRNELDVLRLPGVDQLLRYTDILVDGPYEVSLQENGRRWVGSTNQQFHYLTERYDAQIEKRDVVERLIEVRINSDGTVFVNGWPEKISI